MRGGIALERGRPPVREEAKAPAGLWLARGGQPPGMSNKTADADRCFIPSHQAWDFLRGGIDAFYRKRQQGGEKPSPSRLRRATSPERERLWQRRKAYRLSADFFQPLANEDETRPLCQGLSPSGELSSAARLRGFSWKQPSPSRLRRATSPEGGGFGKGGKFTAYRLTSSSR